MLNKVGIVHQGVLILHELDVALFKRMFSEWLALFIVPMFSDHHETTVLLRKCVCLETSGVVPHHQLRFTACVYEDWSLFATVNCFLGVVILVIYQVSQLESHVCLISSKLTQVYL
jgi:hypothetical protein